VPLSVLVDVLKELEPSLRSIRAAAAPYIATDLGVTRQQIVDALDFMVSSPKIGSLAIPIDAPGGILQARKAEDMFWTLAGNAVLGKGSRVQLPTVAAEHLVKAIDLARDAGVGLDFAKKSGAARGEWRSIVPLSKNADAIRERAARGAMGAERASQLVGQLVGLQFHPGRITLESVGKRISVEAGAELRDAVRPLWGKNVVVDVVGVITGDGDVRSPRATAIRAISETPMAQFMAAFGTQRDAWGSADATHYIEGLRVPQKH
jgi:hypothetical protein